MVVKAGKSGVLIFGFNLASWIVTILGFVVVIRCVSSVVLFPSPFIMICKI